MDIYAENSKNTRLAAAIAKKYCLAYYNRQLYGTSFLTEITKGVLPEGADGDFALRAFEEAVDDLPAHPAIYSRGYGNIFVRERYMKPEKVSVKEIAKEYGLSDSLVYKRIHEELCIIGEIMAQRGAFSAAADRAEGRGPYAQTG